MRSAIFAFTFHVLLVSAALGETPAFDVAALVTAGKATQQKLNRLQASWIVDTTLSNGAVVQMQMAHSGKSGNWRVIFRIINGPMNLEIVRITSRDGLWYCSDSRGHYKYRAYELPAESTAVYLCLDRSMPLFITDATALDGGKTEGIKDGILTIRQPLEEGLITTMRTAMASLDKLREQAPQAITPESEAMYAMMRDSIANGQSTLIDTTTGQVVEYGNLKLRTRVHSLKFLEQSDESVFDVSIHKWDDFSDDPTVGDVNELLMIGHDPSGSPNRRGGDVDGRLMDLKTGRFRRIPYKGPAMSVGCFLPGRTSVIVSGMDAASGSLRPFLIDLKTGDNRALGGTEFNQGFCLGADLSPDGKTVVLGKFTPGSDLGSQLYLVDVASGNAKPIGKRQDTAFLNWTADGKHIVLVHRENLAMDKPSRNSLAIMDMDGHVNILRRGNWPILLKDRTTIFFEDDETHLWHTCDLNGQNVKQFQDGLPGHFYPTVSPDGKRMIFMRKNNSDRMPVPVEIQLDQPGSRLVTKVPGLWATPAWR